MLKPEFTGQFKKDFTLAVKRGCKPDSLYHKVLGNVFSNLLLGTDYELKNRYMHIDYVEGNRPQSINLILWTARWKNCRFWNWSHKTRKSSSKSL